MPALLPEQIHQKLTAKFGDAVGPLSEPKRDRFCVFKRERLRELAIFLKTDPELAMDFLEDLTASDHPKEGLIRIIFHFFSYKHRHMFVAKVEVPRDEASCEMDSLEPVWKSAEWMEREVWDLYGVRFRGNPDLRRVLLPDDWVGHPLRKDYVESGGYHAISNVRDNPLDLYLNLDREIRASLPPPPAPAPAVPPPAVAAVAAPAKTEAKG